MLGLGCIKAIIKRLHRIYLAGPGGATRRVTVPDEAAQGGMVPDGTDQEVWAVYLEAVLHGVEEVFAAVSQGFPSFLLLHSSSTLNKLNQVETLFNIKRRKLLWQFTYSIISTITFVTSNIHSS